VARPSQNVPEAMKSAMHRRCQGINNINEFMRNDTVGREFLNEVYRKIDSSLARDPAVNAARIRYGIIHG
jgi:hypothetical protein